MNKTHLDLAKLFLKLGFFAYGGPAAHIAMMSDEVVQKRKWFDEQEFLDLLSFTNLIPGPNSTEMAILIGYKKGGKLGLLIAGICFIMPAVLIVLGLAISYNEFQSLQSIRNIFQGMVPAIFAIILAAVAKLITKQRLGVEGSIILILTFVLLYLGVQELPALLIGGLVYLLIMVAKRHRLLAVEPFSLGLLFLVFVKIGAFLYGSGYVLISFIQTELVNKYQWLSNQQMVDMIAIGEITPGPVFTTATAIGTFLGGIPGGLVATAGIFIPSFMFIALVYPLYESIRKNKGIADFMKGVNYASLALMAMAAFRLRGNFSTNILAVGFAAVAFIAIYRLNLNSAYVIVTGALFGLLIL